MESVRALIGLKAVIINKESKILLLQRSEKYSRPSGWDLPGGALSGEEDPTEGIKREIKEETGLDVVNVVPIDVVSMSENNNLIVMIAFQALANS